MLIITLNWLLNLLYMRKLNKVTFPNAHLNCFPFPHNSHAAIHHHHQHIKKCNSLCCDTTFYLMFPTDNTLNMYITHNTKCFCDVCSKVVFRNLNISLLESRTQLQERKFSWGYVSCMYVHTVMRTHMFAGSPLIFI